PWLHPLVRPQRDRATLASCLGRRLTSSVSRPLAGTRDYGWVLSRRHRGAGSRGSIRLTRWWRAPSLYGSSIGHRSLSSLQTRLGGVAARAQTSKAGTREKSRSGWTVDASPTVGTPFPESLETRERLAQPSRLDGSAICSPWFRSTST